MWFLFAFDQRCGGVDPCHGAMQQKIPHGEISHLTRMMKQSPFSGECVGVTPVTSQANAFTSFFTAVCSLMSWSNTAPYSSWSFCISLMWLATLFMAFVATKEDNEKASPPVWS